MSRRSKRHAVVIVQRPDTWQPKSPADFPTPVVLVDSLTLAEAGGVARRFNATELASPSGRWAVAAKDLRKGGGV